MRPTAEQSVRAGKDFLLAVCVAAVSVAFAFTAAISDVGQSWSHALRPAHESSPPSYLASIAVWLTLLSGGALALTIVLNSHRMRLAFGSWLASLAIAVFSVNSTGSLSDLLLLGALALAGVALIALRPPEPASPPSQDLAEIP